MGEVESELKQAGYGLHERLLGGDPTVTAEIAERFMRPLVKKLSARYRRLDDPHLVSTAVEDALLSYFDRPEQYDPRRLNLFSYLRMSADGDLRNMLKRRQKEVSRLISLEPVELGDPESEYTVEVADDFDLESLIIKRASLVWKRLAEILPDAIDQEIVLLIMDGVRATDSFADVLGITDLSPAEQAAEVKRHKDRIKKRLQRNLDLSEFS